MKSDLNSLESVLGVLLTHPHYINQARKDLKNFLLNTNLPEKDKKAFKKFISQYGENFHITAQLTIKKRWEEMSEISELLRIILPEIELQKLWEKFVLSIPLTVPIPVTPLEEAIEFKKFILSEIDLYKDPIKANLICYELEKNNAIIDCAKARLPEITPGFIVITPYYKFHQYPIKISHLITKIKQGVSLEALSQMVIYQEEHLFYFKNLSNNQLTILSSTKSLAPIINSLSKKNTFQEVYTENFSDKFDISQFGNLINTFEKQGILWANNEGTK